MSPDIFSRCVVADEIYIESLVCLREAGLHDGRHTHTPQFMIFTADITPRRAPAQNSKLLPQFGDSFAKFSAGLEPSDV